jgi:uncharacterized membrane protein
MSFDWAHAGTPVLASFLASLVEMVEAFTVVLAVGTVRGWRGALAGVALALLMLATAAALLGPLLQDLPIAAVKLAIGCLLVLFGLRWLRKAILRAAGIIPLHDEDASYERQRKALANMARGNSRWDPVALGTAFNITVIEGLEVIFIVIAVGASGPAALTSAGVGAFAAFALTAVVGAALHRPLTAVPENTLKLSVGVLLSAFGTFWVGEGCGLTWPADDGAILLLTAGFAGVAWITVRTLRPMRTKANAPAFH